MSSAPMRLPWEEEFSIALKPGTNEIEGLDKILGIKGRFVYVITTPKSFSIQYETGISNICYIGRQSDRSSGNRLHGHAKGWMAKFLILAQCNEPFVLHYCHPRRRNFTESFKDIEACLLGVFLDKFGQLPLFNKRLETQWASHDVELNTSIFNRRPSRTKWRIDARRLLSSEIKEST